MSDTMNRKLPSGWSEARKIIFAHCCDKFPANDPFDLMGLVEECFGKISHLRATPSPADGTVIERVKRFANVVEKDRFYGSQQLSDLRALIALAECRPAAGDWSDDASVERAWKAYQKTPSRPSHEAILAALKAAGPPPPAQWPEGRKLCRREPTPDQIKAVALAFGAKTGELLAILTDVTESETLKVIVAACHAMWDAAPPPPPQPPRNPGELQTQLAGNLGGLGSDAGGPPSHASALAMSFPDVGPRGQKWCQPGDRPNRQWMLIFDDPDRNRMFWADEDGERQAREAFAKVWPSWSCSLFCAASWSAVPPSDALAELVAACEPFVSAYAATAGYGPTEIGDEDGWRTNAVRNHVSAEDFRRLATAVEALGVRA